MLIEVYRKDTGYGEIFNVGSEKTNRIGENFKLISSITKFKGKLKVETKRVRPSRSEVVKLHSSSKKFKLLFKWKTKTNLREGLKKTIDWYIKNQKLFQKIITNTLYEKSTHKKYKQIGKNIFYSRDRR